MWNRSQPDSPNESGGVKHIGHSATGSQWSVSPADEVHAPQDAPPAAVQPQVAPASAWLPKGFSPDDEGQTDGSGPDDQRLTVPTQHAAVWAPPTRGPGPRWIEIARASADAASVRHEEPQPRVAASEPAATRSAADNNHAASSSQWLPPGERAHDAEVVNQPPPVESSRAVEASPWLPVALQPAAEESTPPPEVSERAEAANERPRPEPSREHETKDADSWPAPPAESEVPEMAFEPEPVAPEHPVDDDSQPTTELDAHGVVAALASYDRRLKAVESYCRELCPTDDGMAAARYALDALDISTGDSEVLLMTTRVLAAEGIASDAEGIAGSERIATRRDRCSSTPGLLAARANGSLSSREHGRLERHLDSCLVCRAAELRASRADRAFAAILQLPLGPADRG